MYVCTVHNINTWNILAAHFPLKRQRHFLDNKLFACSFNFLIAAACPASLPLSLSLPSFSLSLSLATSSFCYTARCPSSVLVAFAGALETGDNDADVCNAAWQEQKQVRMPMTLCKCSTVKYPVTTCGTIKLYLSFVYYSCSA